MPTLSHTTSPAKPRRSAKPALVRLLMVAALLCVAVAAMTAQPYAIERAPGDALVMDYRPCAPGIETAREHFGFGCNYKSARVHGNVLTRTFTLTTADGQTLRVRSADPVWSEGRQPVEHNTSAIWALYAITVAALGCALRILSGKLAAQGATAAGIAIAILALTAVWTYPSMRERLAVYRVEGSEDQYRKADGNSDAPVFVSLTERGDLFRLGKGNFDHLTRLTGYGCRFYDRDGRVIDIPARPGEPVPRSRVPADVRVAGMCLFPQYKSERE